MGPNMDNLSREADAMLVPLAGRLDAVPHPGEAVVERVKSAVRHEINERWLATQPTVAPSPELIDHVRTAVHDRLGCAPARTTPGTLRRTSSRRLRWQPWIAGFSAAAMMAVCAGLIRQAGLLNANGDIVAARQPVDLFVEAAEVALATEDAGGARRSVSGSRTDVTAEGELDELNDAVEDVLGHPQPKDSTMKAPTARQGVLG